MIGANIKWYLAVAHRNSVLASVDHDKRDEEGNRLALFRAEEELTNMGAHVYYPRATIAANRLNRRVKIDRTLLYNYIFVGIPEQLDIDQVDQAKGIYKVLRDIDGNYAEVSVRYVARFQNNELKKEYDETVRCAESNPLEKGDRVRFISGKFMGYIGTVLKCLGTRKAVISVAGRASVRAPIHCLEDA